MAENQVKCRHMYNPGVTRFPIAVLYQVLRTIYRLGVFYPYTLDPVEEYFGAPHTGLLR